MFLGFALIIFMEKKETEYSFTIFFRSWTQEYGFHCLWAAMDLYTRIFLPIRLATRDNLFILAHRVYPLRFNWIQTPICLACEGEARAWLMELSHEPEWMPLGVEPKTHSFLNHMTRAYVVARTCPQNKVHASLRNIRPLSRLQVSPH